jgi:hypothetical protein
VQCAGGHPRRASCQHAQTQYYWCAGVLVCWQPVISSAGSLTNLVLPRAVRAARLFV